MTEAAIIQRPDWSLYDNDLRHERVKRKLYVSSYQLFLKTARKTL